VTCHLKTIKTAIGGKNFEVSPSLFSFVNCHHNTHRVRNKCKTADHKCQLSEATTIIA
jgi:hypothetical protein